MNTRSRGDVVASSEVSRNFLYLVKCHAEGLIEEITKRGFAGGPSGNEPTRKAIRARVIDLVELCDAVLGPWPNGGPDGQS